eukprot:CAMPEP_0175537184 /NCGR_PEP_ID=MMETSP0096-20121207/25086_1 /TAXON_ID=311494 /ORGANISM="Alexandrium monilatum, Strain CCMP3105" /LENGTH=106 /DNA_ID=CAMNT_0016840009 /DNA_START=300 /DNA_END=616 /DNA_ORIENTATION=-
MTTRLLLGRPTGPVRRRLRWPGSTSSSPVSGAGAADPSGTSGDRCSGGPRRDSAPPAPPASLWPRAALRLAAAPALEGAALVRMRPLPTGPDAEAGPASDAPSRSS